MRVRTYDKKLYGFTCGECGKVEQLKYGAYWYRKNLGTGKCQSCSNKGERGRKFRKGHTPWNKGLKGWTERCAAGFQKGNKLGAGERNPNWKGGITPIAKQIRNSKKYKEWRLSIFKRDDFTCRLCGESPSNRLNVDHYPKTFSEIVEENNIRSMDDAINCNELWRVEGNRTLCVDCHKETPTYLNRWGKKDKV